MKKISYYILSFLLFILSLSGMSACVDESVNVKRDGADAYIYNEMRYVYMEDFVQYNEDISKNAQKIGYAYNGIGLKIAVYGANKTKEQDVLIFRNSHFNSNNNKC